MLHRLTAVTIGVPNVDLAAGYYADLGLEPRGEGRFETVDGGEQLHLARTPVRCLLEIALGADDPDDLDRIASQLEPMALPVQRDESSLRVREPVTGTQVKVEILPRLRQTARPAAEYNAPGLPVRSGRAPGILRDERVRPRRLGHVVIGSTDQATTQRFFAQGVGFKISDEVPELAAFMRCSEDHHNLLVLSTPANLLHHTAWEVDDIDEVGRGAGQMLAEHPERHVWGLGRHHIGSNFFWYLKDPAGNFTEYYSDLDCIVDDELWRPEVFEGARGLYNWGPPPPPTFLEPEDLPELMAAAAGRG